MEHLLFVDTTQAGLLILRRAVERGHRVSFVRGMSVNYYHTDKSFYRLLDKIERVIEIPNSFSADALTDVIGEVHAVDPVDAVLGQYDPMMEALATACARVGLPFTSAAGIRNAHNKGRTRQLVADAGLTSARYAAVRDTASAVAAADAIGYPVVVKPVEGMDSVLSFRADDMEAVGKAAEAILAAAHDQQTPEKVRRLLADGILIEEYLVGELVSAEIATFGDQHLRFLICGRSRGAENDCIELGAVLPANIDAEESDRCFDYAERVCRAVGLDRGVFHVEMMLTNRGPVLVEVNPRVMGGAMVLLYTMLTGTDFSDSVLDLHLGRRPQAVPVPPGRTITARRLMPCHNGHLGDPITLDWVDDPATGIASFEDFGLTASTAVQEQQLLARFAVIGDSWLAAMHHANELVGRFETALGIPLIRPAVVSGATA